MSIMFSQHSNILNSAPHGTCPCAPALPSSGTQRQGSEMAGGYTNRSLMSTKDMFSGESGGSGQCRWRPSPGIHVPRVQPESAGSGTREEHKVAQDRVRALGRGRQRDSPAPCCGCLMVPQLRPEPGSRDSAACNSSIRALSGECRG